MTNILSPDEYRIAPSGTIEFTPDTRDGEDRVDLHMSSLASVADLARVAEGFAKPRRPASPDDIDEDRNERRQDEMGRQLGRGVVESVVHQHEIAVSQNESGLTTGEAVEPMKVGVEVSPKALQAICVLVIGLRSREIHDSKVATWND